jgi:hypothetical protein
MFSVGLVHAVLFPLAPFRLRAKFRYGPDVDALTTRDTIRPVSELAYALAFGHDMFDPIFITFVL